MKVTLLSHTKMPTNLIGAAGRACYSDKLPSQLFSTMTMQQIEKQLGLIHGSVFEHASFTFSIEGVSRVTTHQLVRHRLASFSQQSQRFVDVHKLWDHIVIPPKVQEVMDDEDELADSLKDEHMLNAIENYKHALSQLMDELDKHDIPSEDIRYFVPNGVKTNIVMTMNLRELQHFLGLRRCNRAQWEIKQVADEIARIMEEQFPEIVAKVCLGPQCVQNGFCPEHKSCGRYATKNEIFDYAIKGKIREYAHLFKDKMETPKEGE